MNYKEIDRLLIYKNQHLAGELSRIENGCLFGFSDDFLKSDYKQLAFNINKSGLPLKFIGNNLPPFFANLLPEGLRLRALVKNLKTSEDDMFSLFAAVGDGVVGDVYAESKEISREPAIKNKLKNIDFYEVFAATINGLVPAADGNDTFAGIQEKLSSSMITFPLNIIGKDKSYIVKLNSKEHSNLVTNEFLSMQIAQKCGIKTARVKIVNDRNHNQGLLVERFDHEKRDGKIIMHHQEDGCQFLNKYPSEKYRISLNEIAEGIEKLSSAAPFMILALLKLYCFSYLIGNGDLHAKNISLLQKQDSSFVELTPAYDILCTSIYGDRKMAIKIDGRDDNIKSKTILDFGKRFKVPEKAIKSMIENLLTSFAKNKFLLNGILTDSKILFFQEKLMEKRIKDLTV